MKATNPSYPRGPGETRDGCARPSLRRFARRELLLVALGAASSRAIAAPADHREDPRTLRSLSFRCPRALLGRALEALAAPLGVRLTASPALGRHEIMGYLPPRPLRESMDAIAELFDAEWAAADGGYRLDPSPAPWKQLELDQRAAARRIMGQLDAMAATLAGKLRAGEALRGREADQAAALLAWPHIPVPARERALMGEIVTLALPEPAARALLPQILPQGTPLPAARVLVTLDLDDRSDTCLPSLRTHISAIGPAAAYFNTGRVDYWTLLPPAPKPPAFDQGAGEVPFPPGWFKQGAIDGTRDEVIIAVGTAARLPVLARTRSMGGGFGVTVGGRLPSAVLGDIAGGCAAGLSQTARGYYLIRSQTPAADLTGVPIPAAVAALERYDAARKREGPTAAERLAPLAGIPLLHLSTLERANLCTTEIGFVRENYGLVAFLAGLSQAQLLSLRGPSGLPFDSLKPEQLHALLDERYKVAELELREPLRSLRGLSLGAQQVAGGAELTLQLRRGAEVIQTVALELPVPEPEEYPLAQRPE